MLFAAVIVLSWLMTTCGIFVFLTLSNTGQPAEYGRYGSAEKKKKKEKEKTSGWTVQSDVGWMLQESPAFFIPLFFYWTDEHQSAFGLFLTALLLFHYTYRTFIYPFLVRSVSRTPLRIVAMGYVLCTWNGFIQSVWNAHFQPDYDEFYPQFLIYIGVFLFFTGFVIHVISDVRLISLRSYRNPSTYSIPNGLLFRWISCPNYFGECLEWIGFAVAARSFPAIAFAFFTVSRLAPRAFSHHKWYSERFGDEYPKERKALIPFVW
ncbi:unnamed protein product [Caenorhabditis sp. 36 PRJEB53466]|nr:unnamed protein product [Caenorhabditis sp. 36 PRJEB53466]